MEKYFLAHSLQGVTPVTLIEGNEDYWKAIREKECGYMICDGSEAGFFHLMGCHKTYTEVLGYYECTLEEFTNLRADTEQGIEEYKAMIHWRERDIVSFNARILELEQLLTRLNETSTK